MGVMVNMENEETKVALSEEKRNFENEDEELLAEGDVLQFVSFELDNIRYGISILSVHEILRYPEMTRLPNVPRFIKGVINLRGNVIPVVNIRTRFSFTETEITDFTRIIVVDNEGKLIGLLVDSVSQVIRIPERNIDPPSEIIEGVSKDFISGIGRLDGALIIILSLNHLLFPRHEEEKNMFLEMK